MIRALGLGAALLLVAGNVWAGGYTCYFKDDVSACEADDYVTKLLSPQPSAIKGHFEIDGVQLGSEIGKGARSATKDDIDAINKRLDELLRIICARDGAGCVWSGGIR